MKVHELKAWPESFDAIWRGMKTAEYRHDDGRGFAAGDILELEEWEPSTEAMWCKLCRHGIPLHSDADSLRPTCRGHGDGMESCDCTRTQAGISDQDPDPTVGDYTGRRIVVEVAHCMYGPNFGVPKGYVVMSIRVTEARE